MRVAGIDVNGRVQLSVDNGVAPVVQDLVAGEVAYGCGGFVERGFLPVADARKEQHLVGRELRTDGLVFQILLMEKVDIQHQFAVLFVCEGVGGEEVVA